MAKVTAIIPARGGSKGVPRKNLTDINGKPLVVWSIEQALAASSVDQVVVSSDSHEIGAVALAHGAEFIERPESISGDEASTELAVQHAIDNGVGREGLICLLQPTSPIRQPSDIDNAIRIFRDNELDSLFSARHVEGFTWRCNGNLRSDYDFDNRLRRQDLEAETVEENGSIYLFTSWNFQRCNNRLGGKIGVYRQHALDSFQIDTPDDLELIRALMPVRLGGG